MNLLKSKKFRVALLGVLTPIAVKLGMPETTVAELALIVSPFLAFIGAQGYAERDQKAIEANAAVVTRGRR